MHSDDNAIHLGSIDLDSMLRLKSSLGRLNFYEICILHVLSFLEAALFAKCSPLFGLESNFLLISLQFHKD